jgi:hypothetical protein
LPLAINFLVDKIDDCLDILELNELFDKTVIELNSSKDNSKLYCDNVNRMLTDSRIKQLIE